MNTEPEILKLIQKKGDFSDQVAAKIIAKPKLLPVILEGVSSPTPRVKFRSAKILRIISIKAPELLYPHWDFFIDLLNSDNSIIMWNALDVIANLTSTDSEHRFDEIFSQYYQFLEDESMVTAAHVVDNSAKIVINRPDLQDKITEALLKVDKIPRDENCQDILAGKAILTFQNYYDSIKDKDKVISFAEKQTTSKRNATRTKALKFLEKFKD
ncbi:MAG: hypothetical protein A4E27_00360 [Methanobacterium sp. PtaU1.Bin242]|nr:MAG: hypothetical protein A4E27_00360 [Methanobacterium sp. PtaU1.Bin242]